MKTGKVNGGDGDATHRVKISKLGRIQGLLPKCGTSFFCAAGVASLLFTGCSSITESLESERKAMVKMPVVAEPGSGKQRRANGIAFQQVFAAPSLGGTRPATWFLAWRLDGQPLLGDKTGLAQIADAAFGAWKRYPILVEENFTFKSTGRRFGKPETRTGTPMPGEAESSLVDGRGSKSVMTKGPATQWPYKMTKSDIVDWQKRHPGEPVPDFDPLWHLGDGYTQLRSARVEAKLKKGESPIKIGHLDNGFTAGHVGRPTDMFRDSRASNAPALAIAVQQDLLKDHPTPGQTRGSHGTGSIGILAGGRISMPPSVAGKVRVGGINEAIGGAPEAKVLSVRVAPWVGSLSSAELAYGIDLASRVNGCEVISLSHGGLPTVAWADAVNAAYERGTAIFAAESDFFSLVPRPFYPSAFIWPSSPVWPAAFRRVIGVTGVQKDGVTYAKGGLNPFKGFMRGSYGPDGARNFGLFSDRRGDPQTVYYGGELRAHPLAAYAPNIVWPAIRYDKKTGQQYLDGLEFDGGGTSSATPQVAAAAALWLQKHRLGFTPSEWNSWKRAEAVYFALLSSADRTSSKGKPDMYLGAGIVKAKDALAITPRAAMASKQGKPGSIPDLHFPERLSKDGKRDYGMASDFCDGERSAKAFFGLKFLSIRNSDPTKRKTLDEKSNVNETRGEAMKRILENDELIRAWRSGKNPMKKGS